MLDDLIQDQGEYALIIEDSHHGPNVTGYYHLSDTRTEHTALQLAYLQACNFDVKNASSINTLMAKILPKIANNIPACISTFAATKKKYKPVAKRTKPVSAT